MAIPFAVISQWELQVINFATVFTKGKAKKDYFLPRKVLPGNCWDFYFISKGRPIKAAIFFGFQAQISLPELLTKPDVFPGKPTDLTRISGFLRNFRPTGCPPRKLPAPACQWDL